MAHLLLVVWPIRILMCMQTVLVMRYRRVKLQKMQMVLHQMFRGYLSQVLKQESLVWKQSVLVRLDKCQNILLMKHFNLLI
uniref:Uncharacterized protein n=1 Tax=Zea mays TaxID=4577 RepID=C4J2X1_MAIZE|nr:unknown [Zea mays]